jgi:hypothetical protein
MVAPESASELPPSVAVTVAPMQVLEAPCGVALRRFAG